MNFPFPDNKTNIDTNTKIIILAGATGDLGGRIAKHLLQKGAEVRALVRRGSKSSRIITLKEKGATVIEVDFNSHKELVQACKGGTCFVSAVSGLREVIIDLQRKLLNAAVEARVPRFIPSDYSIDFTKLSPGSNRNLDLRREFYEHVNKAPIAVTSVLNGMFTDLLKGQAPVILFGLKRVVYWGSADQMLDFTSIDNTAEYTAAAAIDKKTPRFLKIAGEVTNIKGLKKTASELIGKEFGLLRAGGLGSLKAMSKITRFMSPKKDEVFPAWQGMQYLHNMFTGLPKLNQLDNNRYPEIKWELVKDILQENKQ